MIALSRLQPRPQSRTYASAFGLLLLFFAVLFPIQAASAESYIPQLESSEAEIVIEDFDDMVTIQDTGFNDFSGNMGALDDQHIEQWAVECDGENCALKLAWHFSGEDRETFTGLFMSLFGLTDTQTTFDGSTIETIRFPEHVLDLNNIDGLTRADAEPRMVQAICTDLSLDLPAGISDGPLQLRVELSDSNGYKHFKRLAISENQEFVTYCWNLRDGAMNRATTVFDLQKAKVLSFVIERENIGDHLRNPLQGTLRIDRVVLIVDQTELQPDTDDELLDLLTYRSYQYFWDWSSRKPTSLHLPQDRSTFGDLLTMGGVGFALPAHAVAAERGWISRTEAISRTVSILRVLDDEDAFCSDAVGCIGHKGWFYHFLGADGRRKLNFDFEETEVDESGNTVELSSIDTSLALMGVLATQSYFDADTPEEQEIRTRAQSIYDRVDWNFMLEPVTQQFYLGWKPDEPRALFPPFAYAADSEGSFSGPCDRAQTLDYYTDEALIIALLALGSDEAPAISPGIVQAIVTQHEDELIKTWPGALFTYQFLHAFMDTRTLQPRPGDEPSSWYENTQQVVEAVMTYAEENPQGFATYGVNTWGISAAEGPTDSYHAYGAPPVALSIAPEEDGTVTYYGMMSSIDYGAAAHGRVVAALKQAWARGHWHARFGLPDAFNDDIAVAIDEDPRPTDDAYFIRNTGDWEGRSLFAIDQGPMLLHLENARSGLIWRLLAENPNMRRALDRLDDPALLTPPASTTRLVVEGETGVGDGQIMARSNASNRSTLLLHQGESRTFTVSMPRHEGEAGRYALRLRYSNDNGPGVTDKVHVAIDGETGDQTEETFSSFDTGGGGHGWNVFVLSPETGRLAGGSYSVTLTIQESDQYGIEIDALVFDLVPDYCNVDVLPISIYVPSVSAP